MAEFQHGANVVLKAAIERLSSDYYSVVMAMTQAHRTAEIINNYLLPTSVPHKADAVLTES